MDEEQASLERRSGVPAHPERLTIGGAVAVGAVVGMIIGYFAVVGLWGAVIGALFGAVAAGGILAVALDQGRRRRARDEILDREIGVIGGDIGAA